jgi:CRISPR-associated protein Cmr6
VRTALARLGPPHHLGLAYESWAPVGLDGKVPDNRRPDWLAQLAGLQVSSDYRWTFERWKQSFRSAGDRLFELRLATRLLVGHGNSSATDVGLTVHHTWGVPIIPGSALKGLLAHYVDAVYGPDHPELAPWDQSPDEQRERARYQGVTWRGRRIERGPGDIYRALFGAPEAQTDDMMREHGLAAGAARGLVTFHDALYVPRSAPDDKPYSTDVLTVHQKNYYDFSGRTHWPNDYDSPNPIGFLSVRPGVRLLFALSGPLDWTALAERLLRDALEQWGIGGKTSAGYGRLVSPERSLASGDSAGTLRGAAYSVPKPGDRVEGILLEERTKKGAWKARHEPSGLSGHIINSSDVPASAKPGDHLELIVAPAPAGEIAFQFSGPTDPARAGKKKGQKKQR